MTLKSNYNMPQQTDRRVKTVAILMSILVL